MQIARVRERARGLGAAALCLFGLSLSGHRGLQAQVAADTSSTGRVLGQVVIDGTFRAVSDAFVSLNDAEVGVRSDSAGLFSMRSVAPGQYMLTVRAVGYNVFRSLITVRAGQAVDRELVLSPLVNRLDSVTAVAKPGILDINIAGFEERRATGLGRFLTEKEIDQGQGRGLANLLRSKVPGLSVVRYAGRSVLASGRGAISVSETPGGDAFDEAQGAPKRCYVQVIVNNIARYSSGKTEPLYNLDNMDPSNVIGIEYYTVSTTPPQFNRRGNAPCGTLIIWLRN